MYAENSHVICVNETWLTKISATLKYCILALQYLGEIGLIEVVVEFLSQSRQPPSNLNLNRKPSCSSLRSFLQILLHLLVKEFYCFCYRPPNEDPSWMDVFDNFLHEVCVQFGGSCYSTDVSGLTDLLLVFARSVINTVHKARND